MYNTNNNYRRVSDSTRSRRGFPFHWFGESDPRFLPFSLMELENEIHPEMQPHPMEQRAKTPPVSPTKPLTNSEKESPVKNEAVIQVAAASECQEILPKKVSNSTKGKGKSPKIKARQPRKRSYVKCLIAGHALHKDLTVKNKNATRRTTSKYVKKPKSSNASERELTLSTRCHDKENSLADCAPPVTTPEDGDGWEDVDVEDDYSVQSNVEDDYSVQSNVGDEYSVHSNEGDDYSVHSNEGDDYSVQSNVGDDYSVQSNVGDDYSVQSNVGDDYSVQSNVGDDYSVQSNVGDDYSVQSNVEDDYSVQSNVEDDYSVQSNVEDDYSVQSTVGVDYSVQSNVGDDYSVQSSKSRSNLDTFEFLTDLSSSSTSTSSSSDELYLQEHHSNRATPDVPEQKPHLSDSISDEFYTDDQKVSMVATANKSNISRVIVDTPKSRHSWSNGSNEEGELPGLSERKKQVRRNLFQTSEVHSASQQMFSSTEQSDNTMEPNKLSPPGIFMPDSTSYESLESDLHHPPQDFFEAYIWGHSNPQSNRKSRVLSLLANRQYVENSHVISKEAEDHQIWRNTEQNDNWTDQGLTGLTDVSTPNTSDSGAHRASAPQDPMDRPIISCNGPWNIYTDIPPPPSSPIAQPSDIAPYDPIIMGLILSGMQAVMGLSFPEANIAIPKPRYNIPLPTEGFSRTPGQRNMFSYCNAPEEFYSLTYNPKEEFDNLVPYAYPPMCLPNQPVTDETSNQEDAKKEKELLDKRIKRAEEELIKEREKILNFERQIYFTLNEERKKLIEKLKMAIKSQTNPVLRKKLEKLLLASQLFDTNENLQESEELDEETTLTKVRETQECIIQLLSTLTTLATQCLENKQGYSDEGLENGRGYVMEGACCAEENICFDLIQELLYADDDSDIQERSGEN